MVNKSFLGLPPTNPKFQILLVIPKAIPILKTNCDVSPVADPKIVEENVVVPNLNASRGKHIGRRTWLWAIARIINFSGTIVTVGMTPRLVTINGDSRFICETMPLIPKG
jgi:hypothetical protein